MFKIIGFHLQRNNEFRYIYIYGFRENIYCNLFFSIYVSLFHYSDRERERDSMFVDFTIKMSGLSMKRPILSFIYTFCLLQLISVAMRL